MNFDNAVERSFGTIRQMLQDRGADTASLTSMSAADVLAIAAARNVFHVDLDSCKTRIVYNMNAKFKLADIRKLLEEEAPEVFIVVTRDKPTHPGRKGVDELGKDVQFFDVRELQFNVSRHQHVPRHEPIRDEASIEEIVRRYRLKTRFHMPLILSGDPMARYLALKHGHVVRITRASPSAGTYVMYRCCQRSV
jgi:DNA-directed RNA polymerase subunit H (RpoH/RPB5)